MKYLLIPVVAFTLLVSACSPTTSTPVVGSEPTIAVAATQPAEAEDESSSESESDDSLSKTSDQAGKFKLVGKVQNIQGESWVISGMTVEVEPGNLPLGTLFQTGDVVKVEGMIVDGVLVLVEIESENEKPDDSSSGKDDQHGEFEVYGVLQDIQGSAWLISGLWVLVDTATELDDDTQIQIGDVVKVEGLIKDGVLVAAEIEIDTDGDDDLSENSNTNSNTNSNDNDNDDDDDDDDDNDNSDDDESEDDDNGNDGDEDEDEDD
ncbi:MAG: DUF5666 domain-containing protein [Anaerolineaceae bacterium]|nr:DUF5666 domain-containing protein [Anaerolineaceae bacterium]